MNRSRPPCRCASNTGSAPRADTMAGRAESSLRSSTAPTQDYDDMVEVVQDTGKLEHTKDSAIKIPFKRRGEDSGRSVSGPIALHDQHYLYDLE